MPDFKIHSPYQMAGDQPEAVAKLVEGINNGLTEQTLMGVTGSGKTFTMANIIEQTQRPTLVLAHNKTLAAQLCTELREFFPENAVEYFVSYYDYYQPEAYIASTDTYIEKDSAINDEIDRLRHSATSALSERRDVIIVSSVSCIYSLGDPIDYKSMVISIRPGMEMSREELIRRLIDIQYERNDIAFERNRFRVRGDTVEIWPVYSDEDVVRIEFFGDEVDRISRINPLTGVSLGELGHIAVFPASHYVTPKEKLEEAIKDLEEELEQRVKYFEENGKLIEAQRIAQRTIGQTGDQFRAVGGQLQLFFPGDILHPPGDILRPDAGKIVPLAAGEDGGGHFLDLGVARMKMTCAGGSSSVFSSALKAAVDSMCTSSMIYTLY